MKHYTKLFFAAAVAALGLASCAKEVAPVETPKDNLVTVHFGATAGIEGATKATLTPDEQETLFTSAWENGDELSVKYTNDNETVGATTKGTVPASWATDHFEAKMPEYHGTWDYNVVYPAPDAESAVDFGSTRTQKGNAYNSKYDLMKGSAIAEGADAGKTADRKDIVFEMTRQTAIAYFHLTSTLDEEVVSAKLSVNDGNIASSTVMLLDHTDGFDLSTKDLNEITITFEEGTAPKASDFQLWYNVLPTEYSKMTLTVETTGHTLTISRTVPEEVLLDEYVAGKLYKVVKKIPAEKWAPKAAYTGGDLVFDFKTVKPEGWPTSKDKAPGGTYKYAVNGVDYSFILGKGGYCAGTTPNSAYLMITKSSSLGLPAIAGYKLTKVIGTLNDAGNPSKKAEICITDGANVVSGGTAQTWDTMGKDYTYTLAETEENTVYYLSVSSTANCQMTKLVLSYEPATPSAPKYSVSFASVEGGTLSASAIKAEEGTEITLTAEPQLGYEFNNDWSVTATDGTVINVVDNKFTMPAQDVTGSGTFSKVAYTITKAAAENGSFIVKNGDAEVTTAFKGDKITLEATPAEGFTFGKWTVTYMDGETEKSFTPSANTFNMPAANVTVSATFVETAHVPVYASVADLIAAGAPTKDGAKVTVTLTDEEITKFHKSGSYTNGVYFTVDTQEVQIYCKDTPANWEVGGTISGTLTNCDWKLYNNTWELCPADYSELTYTAPLPTCATPVITIAEGGVVSIACETAGATIHYTVGDSHADPTEADAVFNAVTLTDGQTIKAIAFAEGYKPSAVASKKYTAGGAVESKTYTLQFGKNYNSASIQNYTSTWSVTCDGFTWGMVNWNNNQNGWTNVRAGRKDKASVATITTKTTMPEAISTITMTIDEINATYVNSIKLEVLSADEKTVKETITGEKVKGNCVFNITNPQKDCKYKITVDCKGMTGNKAKNGFVQVSKVVYTNN